MPPNTGTSLQGLAGVGQLYQDRRVFRPDEIIDFVGGADNAPYYVLRSMLDFEECRDEKIRWFMRDDFEAAVVVTAAATNIATTIILKSGHQSRLVGGQTLYSPRTGEHLMVNTTPGSTSVSVTRAIATDLISGLAIKAGEVLFVQAVTMEDGSKPVDTYSRQPWTEHNWIEMNRKGWRVSGRAQKIELWGQAKLQYEEEQQVRSFMREH